jgi:hypothetical protein
LCGPQPKAQRNQPLLGAVMQVAFQTAARIIGGRHDADARGDQLVAGGGIGDRGRDQIGEIGHAPIDIRGQRLGSRSHSGHAPQVPADNDRHAHRALHTKLTNPCRGCA